tara:strand:+ start:4360 stop:4554 length:195 start_codon:yes stop_codon:yes gene_type:complete
MPRTTIADVDKKIAVIEQALRSHQQTCEILSHETLHRVKRLEYLLFATLFSVIGGTILVIVQSV